MRKMIFSSLFVLTMGLVSANSNVTTTNVVVTESIVMTAVKSDVELQAKWNLLNEKQKLLVISTIENIESDKIISAEDDSVGCWLAGKAAQIGARLLGADKEEAKEIGQFIESLCEAIFG